MPYIIAASVGTVACVYVDGRIFVRGRVVDETGLGIPNAAIQLRDGSAKFEHRSGEDGCFEIGHVVAPGGRQIGIEISAPGFESADGSVTSLQQNWVVVTLRRTGGGRKSLIAIAVGRWPQGTSPGSCQFSTVH